MKKYEYVNSLGLNKCLIVNDERPDKKGRYPVELLCLDTGELCGLDRLDHDALAEFLANYEIAIDF